jgi:hypothetical protein
LAYPQFTKYDTKVKVMIHPTAHFAGEVHAVWRLLRSHADQWDNKPEAKPLMNARMALLRGHSRLERGEGYQIDEQQ